MPWNCKKEAQVQTPSNKYNYLELLKSNTNSQAYNIGKEKLECIRYKYA
jgi:hypothetical protein